MSEKQIEIIARGVLCVDGKVLLCHTKGADNTYLPGGHVDYGEGARESLAREITEELGVDAQVGDFLGVVEHQFMQKGEPHCEVNLVFRFECDPLTPATLPPSMEDYIEFCWTPVEQLVAAKLEPAPLCELVPKWLTANVELLPSFASTF